MHWVIQDNLYQENGYTALAEALLRLEIPHDVVKVVPFSEDLSEDQQTIPHIIPTGLVMVCGSITLAKIAKKRKWTPGSFLNNNYDYRVWKAEYGDNLLNNEACVCRFADVQPIWSPFFIRPIFDSKSFNGTVTDWDSFVEWQTKVIDLHDTYTSLCKDTMILYGPIKKIQKEYRFFVVDNQIVGQSVYKIGNRVIYDSLVDDDAIFFAKTMINMWQPSRAFVIDVAMTTDGFRIVEINCINSAGFYAIDVMKFVSAIEAMKF